MEAASSQLSPSVCFLKPRGLGAAAALMLRAKHEAQQGSPWGRSRVSQGLTQAPTSATVGCQSHPGPNAKAAVCFYEETCFSQQGPTTEACHAHMSRTATPLKAQSK